jgi:hypothetical protein
MRRAASLLLLLCLPLQRVPAQTPGTTPAGTSATGPSSAPAGTSASSGASAPAAEKTPPKPDLSVPADTAKAWAVGFSVFSAEGLSTENTYLTHSLPLLLKNEVSGLDAHTSSIEERDLARKAIIAREMATAEQSITNIRKERDALDFGDTPPTTASLRGVDARLEAVVARMDFLYVLDPARVEVAEVKPLAFKEGSGVGKLLDAPTVPAGTYCARQGLDFLVGGSLREIQGYLLLDIWAFDATTGKIVLSSREAAQREEIYASLPAIGKELAGSILGRAWTMVSFTPVPPGALLYVDGTLVASGASPALYLSPGTREIRVSALGYSDESRIVTLEPGQETSLSVELAKQTTGTVYVTSEPSGAALYLDSVWKGKTPLSVERPPTRSRGVLSLTGFYDLPFSMGNDSVAQLNFALQADIGARDVLQKKARNDFYASFGWFAVSLSVPLFCYAFTIDSLVQVNEYELQGMSSRADSARNSYQLFQDGYYAGIAISTALFTWMVFRIITYVSVSNGTAG